MGRRIWYWIFLPILLLLSITFGGGKNVEKVSPPIEEVILSAAPTVVLHPTLPVAPRSVDLEIRSYHSTPPDQTPLEWIPPEPLRSRLVKGITRWEYLVNYLVEAHFPDVDPVIVLGMIAQESQGDPRLVTNILGTKGIGLLQVSEQSWTGTEKEMLDPRANLEVGIWIFDSALKKAVSEYNYRPGYDQTRAALAAFNCGWESLHESRCYYFGGWTYADKVLNYWVPMIQEHIQGENSDEEDFAVSCSVIGGGFLCPE